MCVLPDEEVVGSPKSQTKVMILDTKSHSSSFDVKRRAKSNGYKDSIDSDTLSYCEEKRINSDDDSDSEVWRHTRDVTVNHMTTRGLDTLATMAMKAQYKEHQEKTSLEGNNIMHKADVSREQTSNNDVIPSNKKVKTNKPENTTNAFATSVDTRPSSNHRSFERSLYSPPFNRHPPMGHYMPGYLLPSPNAFYASGRYMPSPPRNTSSPDYSGHYYPPATYVIPHTYDARYNKLLSQESEQVNNESHRSSKPLKKRKLQDSEENETLVLNIICNNKRKQSNRDDAVGKDDGEGNDMNQDCLEYPKTIARESSEVVTPSPRSVERSANSSVSISTTKDSLIAESKTISHPDSKESTAEKSNAAGMKTPSPPNVHPSSARGTYHLGYSPHHCHGTPHHPFPFHIAQMKPSDRGLISTRHHYPYPNHHYHLSHYYSPPPHELGPYSHRHPYPYPPIHHPPHPGAAADVQPHKPIAVISDSNAENSPKKYKSPTKKTDCPSKGLNILKTENVLGENKSGRRCVHIYGPMLIHFLSKRHTKESEATLMPLPSFCKLINYPEYLPQKNNIENSTISDNEAKHKTNPATKNCVMCGTCCFFVGTCESKDKDNQPTTSSPYIIPRQNKGLCTTCDVKIWLVCDLNVTIKWCKGCKNFKQWSAFGEKSRATKCTKCRVRQKEKYAAQKEALRKKREIEKVCRSDDEEHERRGSKASDDEMNAASGLCNMLNGCV